MRIATNTNMKMFAYVNVIGKYARCHYKNVSVTISSSSSPSSSSVAAATYYTCLSKYLIDTWDCVLSWLGLAWLCITSDVRLFSSLLFSNLCNIHHLRSVWAEHARHSIMIWTSASSSISISIFRWWCLLFSRLWCFDFTYGVLTKCCTVLSISMINFNYHKNKRDSNAFALKNWWILN